jgi:hypothetical protein
VLMVILSRSVAVLYGRSLRKIAVGPWAVTRRH